MRSADNIEDMIRNTKIRTNPEVNKAVLNDLLNRMDHTEGVHGSTRQHNTWRIIMKSRMTKLATAAVVILAVVIGINQFGGSIDGASVAWADVEATFFAQPWIHIEYDNGREEWQNLREGKVFYKNEAGWRYFVDIHQKVQHNYFPGQKYISESILSLRHEDQDPSWKPRTAWDVIVSPLDDRSTKKQCVTYNDVEKHFEILDGRKLLRFDVYLTDALNQRILTQQVWADPKIRLPVRICKKLNANQREQQGRDYIIGIFEFPETGPTSIYDLGVPENLEIVNRREREKLTLFGASQVIQKSKEYSEDFPEHYRGVIWADINKTTPSEVNVIYRNGHKLHVSTYQFNQHILKQEHVGRLLTAEDILERTQYSECRRVYIYDGEREYSRRNSLSHWDEANSQAKVVVRRAKGPSTIGLQLRLEKRLWPHVGWANGRHCEVVFDHPDNPTGCVAIQAEEENFFFINPDIDYIAVGRIRMKAINGILQKFMETWWSDFKQLPTGHWYPTKEIFTSYGDPESGTSGHVENRNIHIQLLEENEFPADIFNGETLLEGAEVETY